VKDTIVQSACKEVAYTFQRSAFSDNILKEVDPFHWNTQTFIPFPCKVPPLFILGLYLVPYDLAFPVNDPEHLALSTYQVGQLKSIENAGAGIVLLSLMFFFFFLLLLFI
jgi:hypothetical protein